VHLTCGHNLMVDIRTTFCYLCLLAIMSNIAFFISFFYLLAFADWWYDA
jgi:hypothetical protein